MVAVQLDARMVSRTFNQESGDPAVAGLDEWQCGHNWLYLAHPMARLVELGATTRPGTPADFARLIARETEKRSRLIRSSGIKRN